MVQKEISGTHHRPTRQACYLRLVPRTQPTAASFLAQVPGKAACAVYAAFLQQVDGENEGLAEAQERECDAALNEFMTTFFRVAEHANVWQLAVLQQLAPVVYALDAQLAAHKADVELSPAEISAAIVSAVTAISQLSKEDA